MTYLFMRACRTAARRCLGRMTVSGSLLGLAGILLALDHRFSELTWGALALAIGAFLTRGPHDPPERAL